jgi:toxin-antitoxin system PIN domain toxin
VKLVDANVLLHAVNSDAREHSVARSWLEAHLNANEPVAFAWVVLLAFIRVGTRDGIFPSPMSVAEAFDYVEAWITQGPSVVLDPTTRHVSLLRGLLESTGSAGNLASDAHLAALAIEHGATIVSFERDFGRFTGLSWVHPAEDR